MKKQRLEIMLEQLDRVEQPRADLEQYATPAPIAAQALFYAYAQGDIAGKEVADLGCGNGILALGAKVLGAKRVVAVDNDQRCVVVANRNAVKLGAPIEVVKAAVQEFQGIFDTVVQNPPFGAQRRHADRPFLDAAMAIAPVVYSFHNAETRDFIVKRAEREGFEVSMERTFAFRLRAEQPFHRKEVEQVPVLFLRLARTRSQA